MRNRAASGIGCSAKKLLTSAASLGLRKRRQPFHHPSLRHPGHHRKHVVPTDPRATPNGRPGITGQETGEYPEAVLSPDLAVHDLFHGGQGQFLHLDPGHRAEIADSFGWSVRLVVRGPQRLVLLGPTVM